MRFATVLSGLVLGVLVLVEVFVAYRLSLASDRIAGYKEGRLVRARVVDVSDCSSRTRSNSYERIKVEVKGVTKSVRINYDECSGLGVGSFLDVRDLDGHDFVMRPGMEWIGEEWTVVIMFFVWSCVLVLALSRVLKRGLADWL